MACKQIVLFYERHDDRSATRVMHKVLLKLKQKSYNPTVCLEEAIESIDGIKQTYTDGMNNMLYQTNNLIKSFNDDRIKSHINQAGAMGFDGRLYGSYEAAKKGLSRAEKKVNVDQMNDFYLNMVASLKATLDLLDSVSNYCAMDVTNNKKDELHKSSPILEGYKRRSTYMAEQLHKQCDSTDDYVMGLLGSDHFDIGHKLRKAGVKIQDYYIINYTYSPTPGDICMRQDRTNKICKEYPPFKGVVYDLMYSIDTEDSSYEKIIKQVLPSGQQPEENHRQDL
jgi:hypothetical protein